MDKYKNSTFTSAFTSVLTSVFTSVFTSAFTSAFYTSATFSVFTSVCTSIFTGVFHTSVTFSILCPTPVSTTPVDIQVSSPVSTPASHTPGSTTPVLPDPVSTCVYTSGYQCLPVPSTTPAVSLISQQYTVKIHSPNICTRRHPVHSSIALHCVIQTNVRRCVIQTNVRRYNTVIGVISDCYTNKNTLHTHPQRRQHSRHNTRLVTLYFSSDLTYLV